MFVEDLPAVFVLDANLTVLFFTQDPQGDYRAIRSVLDGLGE